MAAPARLAACLLNISAGREQSTVQAVVTAAARAIRTEGHRAAVLHAFADPEYDRSVITICGELAGLEAAVVAAGVVAYRLISVVGPPAAHPRLGAVDLLPVHPVTQDVSLAECGASARNIAVALNNRVPGSAFFFYGGADPAGRRLATRRRELGWFESAVRPGAVADLGQAGPALGLTGAGATPYMTNVTHHCNH